MLIGTVLKFHNPLALRCCLFISQVFLKSSSDSQFLRAAADNLALVGPLVQQELVLYILCDDSSAIIIYLHVYAIYRRITHPLCGFNNTQQVNFGLLLNIPISHEVSIVYIDYKNESTYFFDFRSHQFRPIFMK